MTISPEKAKNVKRANNKLQSSTKLSETYDFRYKTILKKRKRNAVETRTWNPGNNNTRQSNSSGKHKTQKV